MTAKYFANSAKYQITLNRKEPRLSPTMAAPTTT